jgi:hypothetical protein
MAQAQSIEEQRKYKLTNRAILLETLDSQNNLDGFQANYHSDYTYFDIYVDNANLDLYQNNLSLRFRKRDYSNGVVAYGFQLKNEMTEFGSIRMEVEEDELNFYKIKKGDNWVSLTEVLDSLFIEVENESLNFTSESFIRNLSLLNDWIAFKASAPISPFQKLRNLGFDYPAIQDLRPVMIGSSHRARLSVYVNREKASKELRDILGPKNVSEMHQPIWVMECSLDSASFYSLLPNTKAMVTIIEFEVENKYTQREIGTKCMDYFEIRLSDLVGLEPYLDSKYRQGVEGVR